MDELRPSNDRVDPTTGAPPSSDVTSVTETTSASSAASSLVPSDGDRSVLSRSAIERILARAAELQNAPGSSDTSDTVTEAQLLEIAREVGLSATSVRQAIAEERTRVAVDTGATNDWVSRVVGPNIVSATRVVEGRASDVLATLDSWMQREESLQVQRQFPDRIVWEARTDWFNAIRRGLKIGGRSYILCIAQSVAATVIQVDDTRVVVRLDADVSQRRTGHTRGGTIAVAGGLAFAGSLVTVGIVAHAAIAALLVASSIPVGLGGLAGTFVVRQYRQFVGRVQLALEQTLDRLEFTPARKPASLSDIVAAVRPLIR